MNDTRAIMARARSLLDPDVIARQEAEHSAWRAEHADALENAAIDALCAAKPAIKRRDFGELVYKRRDDARAQPFMEPDQQIAWDRWCDSRIGAASETIAKCIGEEVGTIERELRRDYDARLNEMSATISALRLEIGALRARKKKPNA